MKIAQITPEYPPYCGGIGSYVHNLTNFLIKKGINVEVHTPKTKFNIVQTEENDDKLKVYRINTNLEIKSEKINLFLLNKFKKINCDLIHIHGHIWFCSINGAFISKLKNIPLIMTHHGEGYIKSFLTSITRRIRDRIGKELFKHASKVICVNKSEILNLEKKYKIPSEKIHFIPNGAKPKIYNINEKEAELILDNLYKRDYLLYVGFLYKWKNPLILIKIIKEIAKARPELRLVIVGRGPEEIKMRSLINRWNLNKNIILLKFVSEKLLAYLYEHAAIFLFPSIYDVSPTVLLDAMNHSLPVVAYAIPSVMELINNEKNGFLVPINNIKLYEEKILFLLKNKDIQKKFGLNSKNLIEKYYNWNKIGSQILQMYKNALEI